MTTGSPGPDDVDLARLAAAHPSRTARMVSAVLTPSLTLLATCGYVALRHDAPARAVLWWLITLVIVVGTRCGKPSLHLAVATGSVVMVVVETHILAWTGLQVGAMIDAGVTGALYPLLR